jgi:hypothetical protein
MKSKENLLKKVKGYLVRQNHFSQRFDEFW